MFTTKIQWHNASEELPDKSCDVIVACNDEDYCEIYGIYSVRFSKCHRKFNCYDFEEEPTNTFDDVKYWAYLDDVCSEIKNKGRGVEN